MKRVFKIIIILLLFFGFLFVSKIYAYARESTKEIFTSDFENFSVLTDLEASGWGKISFRSEYTINIDENISHSGNKSISISCEGENHVRLVKEIKVNPDSYYEISCWIKTQDVGKIMKGGCISIDSIKLSSSETITGTSDWTQIFLYGYTGKDQEYIDIAINLGFFSNTNNGTVWFDDISVKQLIDLKAVSYNRFWRSQNIDNYFFLLYTLIFVALFLLLWYLIKKELIELPENIFFLIIIALAGLFFKIYIAEKFFGHTPDLSFFRNWAIAAYDKNLINIYSSDVWINYPPLYVYVLYILGWIMNLTYSSATLHLILLKLPAIICDMAIGFYIYKYAKKKFSNSHSILLLISVIFNPALFINSSVWGQVDSIMMVFAVIGIFMIFEKKYIKSAVFVSLAIMVKPQAVIFALPLILVVIRNKDIKIFLKTGMAAIITLYAISIPFSFNPLWIYQLLLKTLGTFKSITLNAYNFFMLFQPDFQFYPETNTFLLFSFKTFGIIFDCLIVLSSLAIFIISRNKKIVSNIMLILSLGAFVFSTKMHERYIYPCVILALICLVVWGKKEYIKYYLAITFTTFINIYCVLCETIKNSDILPIYNISIITIIINIIAFFAIYKTTINLHCKDDILYTKNTIFSCYIEIKEIFANSRKEKNISAQVNLNVVENISELDEKSNFIAEEQDTDNNYNEEKEE